MPGLSANFTHPPTPSLAPALLITLLPAGTPKIARPESPPMVQPTGVPSSNSCLLQGPEDAWGQLAPACFHPWMQVLPHLQALVRVCLPSLLLPHMGAHTCTAIPPSYSPSPHLLRINPRLPCPPMSSGLGWTLCLQCYHLTTTRYSSQISSPSRPNLGSPSSWKPSLTYQVILHAFSAFPQTWDLAPPSQL